VLVVNRKLRVANDVDEQDMGDFKLDLFRNFDGHLDSHGNARHDDTLK